ncbi:related to TAF7-TFIID subunit (TBP-associated factor), 67 kD [Sporisorium reilianum f. sp. reilianum]|uniref:Related to TAF7-TFIID subunit (TBP-associated factor), 67 kD n=1 Tax=Sporisorium reilianum f. sp. reilianum TaxID=72559 RepID=A0A2N8U8H9_9BASI|nr:related to TAF7-TFIID subunit (TBP-associated factor), 67 kD [Sporisorium reilianum f. sp. reilianum]
MSEASGSASPALDASSAELGHGGSRPKRAVRPTAKALLAREQSPEGWEHGGSRRSQPSRPIRTSSGARPQIKLKMKASGGGTAAGAGQGFKTQAYMQSYDRELDSEDDETGQGLAFEEQLIFRMPEGPECDKLRDSIQKRQLGDDVWFKFKDSRRAVVHVGDSLFSAKLVDLPTITESHKTLDNRQFFKVADIAQMLVVEGKIADETQASSGGNGKAFNIDDFVYPHGITPPMHWARKRRFRKRAARRAIETVEKEVERLLKADKKAEQVEYEMIDAAEEGGSEDDEDDQRGGAARRGPSSPGGSQAETPVPDGSHAGSQDEDDEGDEHGEGRRRTDMFEDGGKRGYDEDPDDDDVDEDLAAELDAALEEEDDDDDDGGSTRGAGSEAQSRASDQEDLWDDDDDDDADDGGEEEEDEEDENDEEKEQRVREAQLEAECRELETLVRRKQADVDGTMNLIIKNRHQQALRKLTTERDLKRNQLSDLKQTRKERKEAIQAAAEAEAAEDAAAAASSSADRPSDTTPFRGDDYAEHASGHPQDTAPSADTITGADANPASQNRGMPPPALPASRNLPQPSSSAARVEVPGQASGQNDVGDSDLWDDDEDDNDGG